MMKDKATKKKIVVGALLILVTAGLGTWARYSQNVQGNGSVTAAYYTSDVTITDFPSLPTQPGESAETRIEVKTEKDGKVAETKLKYWFEIETAENLPFVFEISSSATATSQIVTPHTKSNEFALPLSNTSQAVPWTVKVTWPADKNDAAYAELVDYVKVKVHIEQVTE